MALPRVIKQTSPCLAALLMLSGCVEMDEEEVEIGFKGKAKFDHFLAAKRLCTKMGISARSYSHLPSLPPPQGTTVIMPAGSLKSEGTLTEIDDWVYEGGNMIVYLEREASSYWDEDSVEPFLEYYGLEVEEIDADEHTWKAGDEEEDKEAPGEHIESIYFEDTPGLREDYETDYYNHLYLSYADENEQYLCLDYPYGEGYLSIWTSAAPFTNKRLMEAEHASLLWDLVRETKPQEVWFVYSSDVSFWKLIWKHGSYALITLGLLLLVYLWAVVRRFGPVFNTINQTQNTLDEHLTATGAFYTKHRADAIILADLRTEQLKKLARKLALPLNATQNEILTACERSEIITPEHRARYIKLFSASYPESKNERFHYLQELQSLSKTL